MYISVEKHKDREESVLANQQAGWLYESHCWIDAFGEYPYVCKWCGAKSSTDMQVDGHLVPTLCPKNPQVELVLKDLLRKNGLPVNPQSRTCGQCGTKYMVGTMCPKCYGPGGEGWK